MSLSETLVGKGMGFNGDRVIAYLYFSARPFSVGVLTLRLMLLSSR